MNKPIPAQPTKSTGHLSDDPATRTVHPGDKKADYRFAPSEGGAAVGDENPTGANGSHDENSGSNWGNEKSNDGKKSDRQNRPA